MTFQRPDGISYVQTYASAPQDRGFSDTAIFGATGFAVGGLAAVALGASRRSSTSTSRVSTVQMRGWQDEYSGNAFRAGQANRGDRPKQGGNSSFEQEMRATEDAYNQKLLIFSGVATVGFLAFLFVQVKPFL
jgi:hypothetical protein